MNLTADTITAAYDDLAEYDGAWVRIARIHDLISEKPADITATLIEMAKAGRVALAPESRTTAITAADQTAAIHWGSEPLHLVAFQD
jgi:lipocalin